MSIWRSIRLGRSIEGRADSPPHRDERRFELDVATAGNLSDNVRLIGWERIGPDDQGESFEVHLDPSNAYALWSALSIAIAAVGDAHPELTRVTHGTDETGH